MQAAKKGEAAAKQRADAMAEVARNNSQQRSGLVKEAESARRRALENGGHLRQSQVSATIPAPSTHMQSAHISYPQGTCLVNVLSYCDHASLSSFFFYPMLPPFTCL